MPKPPFLPSLPPLPSLPNPNAGALPEPALAQLPQRLRRRLAALSIVGALMVALPLGQVLRYQNADLQSLLAQRAGLDPVARAVDVQRSLLVHRDLAAQVLRGKRALEDERRVRQGEVDDRVGALAVALMNGAWERAVRESDALREDWSLLARQVLQRNLGASESDQAHRLLIEQTLQVMDLLADGSSSVSRRSEEGAVLALAVARSMPRLAGQLAALSAHEAGSVVSPRELAAAEAALARTLGALNAALEKPLPGAEAPQQRRVLATASAIAGAAADRYFQLLRQADPRNADVQTAADAALQAQYRLFDGVAHVVGLALDDRVAVAIERRKLLVSAMAVLALATLGLLLQLARGLAVLGRPALRRYTDGPGDTPHTAPNAGRLATGRLLQRLRGSEVVAASEKPAVNPGPRIHSDGQPTQPAPL